MVNTGPLVLGILGILGGGAALGMVLGDAVDPEMKVRIGPEQVWQQTMRGGSTTDHEYAQVDAGANVRQEPEEEAPAAWAYSDAPPFTGEAMDDFVPYSPRPWDGYVYPEHEPPEYRPSPITRPEPRHSRDDYGVTGWPDDPPREEPESSGPATITVSRGETSEEIPERAARPQEPRAAKGELPAIW